MAKDGEPLKVFTYIFLLSHGGIGRNREFSPRFFISHLGDWYRTAYSACVVTSAWSLEDHGDAYSHQPLSPLHGFNKSIFQVPPFTFRSPPGCHAILTALKFLASLRRYTNTPNQGSKRPCFRQLSPSRSGFSGFCPIKLSCWQNSPLPASSKQDECFGNPISYRNLAANFRFGDVFGDIPGDYLSAFKDMTNY